MIINTKYSDIFTQQLKYPAFNLQPSQPAASNETCTQYKKLLQKIFRRFGSCDVIMYSTVPVVVVDGLSVCPK